MSQQSEPETRWRGSCSICGTPIEPHPITGWDKGNNAEPINSGRCCDHCNDHVVLRARMQNVMTGKSAYESIADLTDGLED